jgi:hypothetical protein
VLCALDIRFISSHLIDWTEVENQTIRYDTILFYNMKGNVKMSTIVTKSSALIFPLFFASIINQNRTNHYDSVLHFFSQNFFL